MIMLKDATFNEILTFLDAVDLHGKGIPTKLQVTRHATHHTTTHHTPRHATNHPTIPRPRPHPHPHAPAVPETAIRQNHRDSSRDRLARSRHSCPRPTIHARDPPFTPLSLDPPYLCRRPQDHPDKPVDTARCNVSYEARTVKKMFLKLRS